MLLYYLLRVNFQERSGAFPTPILQENAASGYAADKLRVLVCGMSAMNTNLQNGRKRNTARYTRLRYYEWVDRAAQRELGLTTKGQAWAVTLEEVRLLKEGASRQWRGSTLRARVNAGCKNHV